MLFSIKPHKVQNLDTEKETTGVLKDKDLKQNGKDKKMTKELPVVPNYNFWVHDSTHGNHGNNSNNCKDGKESVVTKKTNNYYKKRKKEREEHIFF